MLTELCESVSVVGVFSCVRGLKTPEVDMLAWSCDCFSEHNSYLCAAFLLGRMIGGLNKSVAEPGLVTGFSTLLGGLLNGLINVAVLLLRLMTAFSVFGWIWGPRVILPCGNPTKYGLSLAMFLGSNSCLLSVLSRLSVALGERGGQPCFDEVARDFIL